jgi:hypothetical protein
MQGLDDFSFLAVRSPCILLNFPYPPKGGFSFIAPPEGVKTKGLSHCRKEKDAGLSHCMKRKEKLSPAAWKSSAQDRRKISMQPEAFHRGEALCWAYSYDSGPPPPYGGNKGGGVGNEAFPRMRGEDAAASQTL